jgi:hypothetical protein
MKVRPNPFFSPLLFSAAAAAPLCHTSIAGHCNLIEQILPNVPSLAHSIDPSHSHPSYPFFTRHCHTRFPHYTTLHRTAAVAERDSSDENLSLAMAAGHILEVSKKGRRGSFVGPSTPGSKPPIKGSNQRYDCCYGYSDIIIVVVQ